MVMPEAVRSVLVAMPNRPLALSPARCCSRGASAAPPSASRIPLPRTVARGSTRPAGPRSMEETLSGMRDELAASRRAQEALRDEMRGLRDELKEMTVAAPPAALRSFSASHPRADSKTSSLSNPTDSFPEPIPPGTPICDTATSILRSSSLSKPPASESAHRTAALELSSSAARDCGDFDPSSACRFYLYQAGEDEEPPSVEAPPRPSTTARDELFCACCSFLVRTGGPPRIDDRGKHDVLEAWLAGPGGKAFIGDQALHFEALMERAREGAHGKELLAWLRIVQVIAIRTCLPRMPPAHAFLQSTRVATSRASGDLIRSRPISPDLIRSHPTSNLHLPWNGVLPSSPCLHLFSHHVPSPLTIRRSLLVPSSCYRLPSSRWHLARHATSSKPTSYSLTLPYYLALPYPTSILLLGTRRPRSRPATARIRPRPRPCQPPRRLHHSLSRAGDCHLPDLPTSPHLSRTRLPSPPSRRFLSSNLADLFSISCTTSLDLLHDLPRSPARSPSISRTISRRTCSAPSSIRYATSPDLLLP